MKQPDPPDLVLRVQVPPPVTDQDGCASVTFSYDELVFLATAVNCYTYQPDSTRSRMIRHPVCVKLARALQDAVSNTRHWYWTPGVTVLHPNLPPKKVWGHGHHAETT